jgi:hypothetical protein
MAAPEHRNDELVLLNRHCRCCAPVAILTRCLLICINQEGVPVKTFINRGSYSRHYSATIF